MSGTRFSRRRALAVAIAACIICALTASASASAALSLSKVGDFNRPLYVDDAPGNGKLLFVVEAPGTIAVMRDGNEVAHKFLDIRNRVTWGGEQGLLSLAFAPDYQQSGRFYVAYTNSHCTSGGACNVEVDGFRRESGSATRARPASRSKVIEVTHHQAGNHNGGQLQFGPGDGHLYFSIGDGGTQGDPENDAQDKHSLLGKILRIDPRPGGGYDVPATNPYVGSPGRDEIFARGLRNPWRFSFDSATADIWIGDVGWQTWEEIDHEADATGANFGWHKFEGPDPCGGCGFGGGTPEPPGYRAPVHSYAHSGPGETGCAVVGGFVVHNASLPSIDGDYVYSDHCSGTLRRLDPAAPATSSPLGLNVSEPSSFGEGAGGAIYVATTEGGVFELVEN